MLRNLSEKLAEKFAAKFPATSLSYSMAKIAHLNYAFSEMFELEASPVKVNHCYKKIRKGKKRKARKELIDF